MKLKIKPTNKYGNGVFADQNIKKGSLILRCTGLIYDIDGVVFLVNKEIWN